MNAGHGQHTWKRQIAIRKRDTSKRLVLGEVYVPYDPNDSTTVDSHGHATTAREIEQAAHDFLAASRQDCVDVQHDGLTGYGRVVESYLAKQGDPCSNRVPGWWAFVSPTTTHGPRLSRNRSRAFRWRARPSLCLPHRIHGWIPGSKVREISGSPSPNFRDRLASNRYPRQTPPA